MEGDVLLKVNEECFDEDEDFLKRVDNIESTKISKISYYSLNGDVNPQAIQVYDLIMVLKFLF